MSNTQRSEARLKEMFADDFLIGATVNPRTIETQEELLSYHFNSITAENEMKFVSVHPAEDTYTFEDADRRAFARKHGMKMRGHTLVWHNQTTDWLFEDKNRNLVDKATLYERLKSHTDTVVKRYKGDIYAWDVVNEVIADEGAELLRPSKWLDIAGPEFISRHSSMLMKPTRRRCCSITITMSPTRTSGTKSIRWSSRLLDQGTLIHGIGLQAHWNLYDPALDDIRSAIEKYASLGLRLQLTELDVSMFRFEDKRKDLTEAPEELLEAQAKRYEAMFGILKEYRDHITSVTFWGLPTITLGWTISRYGGGRIGPSCSMSGISRNRHFIAWWSVRSRCNLSWRGASLHPNPIRSNISD